MRISQWTRDDKSGAGRAAIRINQSVKIILESQLFCLKQKMKDNCDCRKILTTRVEEGIRILSNKINVYFSARDNSMFSSERFGIIYNDEGYLDADLFHFHYVNLGLYSDKLVKHLIELEKPIIWTLHDMWPFTGGCHYNEGCNRYKSYCGFCPMLSKAKDKDASYRNLQKKIEQLSQLNIQFVGCSKWITGEANASTIVRNIHRKCLTIPNPIFPDSFHYINQSTAREILGLPQNKNIITFGACSATSDPRKGYRYLKTALKKLDPQKYSLVIFGSEFQDPDLDKFHAVSIGWIDDDKKLAQIYNASDVFVSPSIQENLANTVMESLSCGTPVVAFDIGGMPDMIIHKENGYLAQPLDIDDLAEGIEYCAKERKDKADIARKTQERFNPKVIGEQYCQVYQSLLNK